MDKTFQEVLSKIQAMQRTFPSALNCFSVAVKYDDYYGEYAEVELRTDMGKNHFTTYRCVYKEDYYNILEEIGNTLKELRNE